MIEARSIRKITKNLDTMHKGGGTAFQCHSGAKATQGLSTGIYSVRHITN